MAESGFERTGLSRAELRLVPGGVAGSTEDDLPPVRLRREIKEPIRALPEDEVEPGIALPVGGADVRGMPTATVLVGPRRWSRRGGAALRWLCVATSVLGTALIAGGLVG